MPPKIVPNKEAPPFPTRGKPEEKIRWALDHHTGLVYSLARRIGKKHGLLGGEREGFVDPQHVFGDLVNEGLIALQQAAPNYRPELGKPGAYFGKSIMGKLTNAIAIKYGEQTHLSQKIQNALVRLQQAEERLKARLHRAPSEEELARETEALRVEGSKQKAYFKLAKKFGRAPLEEELTAELASRKPVKPLTARGIRELNLLRDRKTSLSEPVGREDEEHLVEHNIPHPQPSPEALLASKEESELVRRAVEQLSDSRFRQIIRERYGLEGDVKTLEETGAGLNPPLTRERIRQLQGKAEKELRKKLGELRKSR